jgi:deoxyadenosine/deoxycytidine kinase
VSGPTGAGKSTFGNALETHGFFLIREEVDQELYNKFTNQPSRYCFELQWQIMSSRREKYQRQSVRRKMVIDRSIDEDLEVFCRLFLELGFLSHTQFYALKQEFGSQTWDIAPDLVLFLFATPEVLSARLKQDGRDSLISDSLELQLALYEDWVASCRHHLVWIDNTNCPKATIDKLLLEISHA